LAPGGAQGCLPLVGVWRRAERPVRCVICDRWSSVSPGICGSLACCKAWPAVGV